MFEDPRFWLLSITAVLIVVLIFNRGSGASIVALSCLILSTAFMNLWTIVPIPSQEKSPEGHTDALIWAYDLWAFGLNAVLVMYLAILVWWLLKPPKIDLMAKLLWTVVLIAEAWHLIFENALCNVVNRGLPGWELSQVWGEEVSKYSCARQYGELAIWAPTMLTVTLLALIVLRYSLWKTRQRGSGW